MVPEAAGEADTASDPNRAAKPLAARVLRAAARRRVAARRRAAARRREAARARADPRGWVLAEGDVADPAREEEVWVIVAVLICGATVAAAFAPRWGVRAPATAPATRRCVSDPRAAFTGVLFAERLPCERCPFPAGFCRLLFPWWIFAFAVPESRLASAEVPRSVSASAVVSTSSATRSGIHDGRRGGASLVLGSFPPNIPWFGQQEGTRPGSPGQGKNPNLRRISRAAGRNPAPGLT